MKKLTAQYKNGKKALFMDKEIRIFIYKLRRRLGIQKAMNIFPFVLSIGFFLGFLHILFGYFHPFYYASIIASFWILTSVLFGVIYFFFHFPKEQEAAHMGDAIIGQERLLTALELRGKNEPISCLQKKDAISYIAVCNIKESFPYQLHFKQLLLCIFMASLFFLFLYLPSKAKLEAEKLHALKQDIKEELILVDDVEKEITQEKISEKQTPSALETIGKKLDKDDKLDTIKELLEQTKKEYSSVDSKQELQKAKERLRVKLENMAEKETSLEKQTTISDLMEELGFSAYHNLNNSNESETTSLSENTSALNKTENQNEANSNANKNYGSNDSNDTSNSSNNNTNKNSSNNSKKNTNKNDDNTNSKLNNSDSTSNQSKNQESNSSSGNQESNKNKAENNASNNQSGNYKGKGSSGNTGKNHGSKKGIERKSKKKKTKEKVMVIADATSQDENLTGAVSDNGNSYQESSNQQLSFGKKENLEKVAKEYAEDALTTINNNNSIPSQMKDIVQSYFSHID